MRLSAGSASGSGHAERPIPKGKRPKISINATIGDPVIRGNTEGTSTNGASSARGGACQQEPEINQEASSAARAVRKASEDTWAKSKET